MAYVATPGRFVPFTPLGPNAERDGYRTANFLMQRTEQTAEHLRIPALLLATFTGAGAVDAGVEAMAGASSVRAALAQGIRAAFSNPKAGVSVAAGRASMVRSAFDSNTYATADSVHQIATSFMPGN